MDGKITSSKTKVDFMATEFMIAPAGGGKTQACIERIRVVKRGNPLALVWVLVPNSQAAAQFKARLAAAGASIGVKVGHFPLFYREILEERGQFVPIITPPLSHRLLQETVREASDAGELGHYQAIKDKPGFLSVLVDAFAEMRGGLVLPEEFLERTRESTPARRELAILYARLDAKLVEIGWSDHEGLSWLAIDALRSSPQASNGLSLVVLDGFTAFTKAQREFVRLLDGQVLIMLTGEGKCERSVHRRTQKVLRELVGELDCSFLTPLPSSRAKLNAPTPSAGQRSGDGKKAIQQMEQYLLVGEGAQPISISEPIMLEARSQAEEAREALRWIKHLHVREGLPLDACALYCADLERYQPLLRSAAKEFGMNIQFSQRDPLAKSPAMLAMLNLLGLPLENFPTRSLLNALNSPYFSFGLADGDVGDLDKVAREAVIVGGREQWDAAWAMLAGRASGVDADLDEERYSLNLLEGIELPALQGRFDQFWRLFEGIEQKRSQAGWIERLESMLEQLGFYELVESERDRAACMALAEALRALVVSEQVVGVREIDYAQLLADLLSGLNGARLEEDRETRKDALFVGKLVEARAARYQAVALLGLSEGLFPVVENPDPFLDEELREELGLESRLERDQVSTFYQAFTRADEHLLLTRPYLSEDGERWEPSPYWHAVEKLFSGDVKADKDKLGTRRASQAASGEELLFWSVQKGRLNYAGDEELLARWENLSKGGEILDARRAKYARGQYEGDLGSLSEVLGQKFSSRHVWSASRLEAYGDCPWRFFTESALGLEIEKTVEPGLDIRQIGSLYHRVLELVYSQASEQGISPLELLDGAAESVFATAPVVFGFRPTVLWEVEQRQHLETLRKTQQALEDKRGSWQPFAFEQKFGIKGTPCLELGVDGEVVRIRGVIDRVDKNENGMIRVIDYKTGGSFGDRDLVEGKRLQLPVYAMAAEEALGLGEVSDGFYWSINAASASSLSLTKFESERGNGVDAACKIGSEHIITNARGVRLGNFKPATPRNGCASYCPASLWCWRYQVRQNND